ncbi:MAG: hypothetical protein L0241_19245 [Planctomycetia bacterium]|nr:hypothetical protein [Planctomycetia bacterium]
MRRFGLAGVFAVVLGFSAVAQDAVEIKIAHPKAGDRLKVTKTEKSTMVMTVEFGGKTDKKTEPESSSVVFVDEIITAGEKGGKPLKLKRTYEKYESEKSGKKTAAPPLKTAILIEKKDKMYEFSVDGKPLEKEFAKKLDGEFNKKDNDLKTEFFLPGKAVKVGETWKIDGAKFAKAFAESGKLAFDGDKTVVTGKLIKMYKKQGKPYGVMEFTVEAPIKDLGVGLTIKAGSVANFKLTVDVNIDGTDPSEQLNGKLAFKIDAEGMGATLAMTIEGTMTENKQLLPKQK